MTHSSPFLLVFLAVSIASAQKVDVFEKASKPEFVPWTKNTTMAQGYGFLVMHTGDSLKGPLKVEKSNNNSISEFNIKTGKVRNTYLPKDVKAYGFYPYTIFTYDPSRPGNPKFYPGYVVTNSGIKLSGKVAIMTVMGSEWKFFPKKIYFIPAKAEMASSMSGGDLLEVGQANKDDLLVFDAFGTGYLQRIVNGKLRLYYNPNPRMIQQPLFFSKRNPADSVQINALQKLIEENIKAEKPLNEAIRSGKDVSASLDVSQVNTEIIDLEYFLIDGHSGKIYQLKEDNFKSILEPLFSLCPSFQKSTPEVKEDLFNYKKIEESIAWYNANCK